MKKSNGSFSLIEVVIFVGILAMFFVTGIAVATYSLQAMRSNENKIRATQYAEELMEWIKAQKEIDWQLFVSNNVGHSYCFNSTINGWSAADPSQCLFTLPGDYTSSTGIFRRYVSLTGNSPPVTQVTVNIQVQWKEPSGTVTVPLTSTLTLWE